MRIGVDIDGVLTDFESYQLDFGTRFFYLRHGIELQDREGFETQQMFLPSVGQDEEFWARYGYDYLVREPARRHSAEVLRRLRDEGHSVHIITARSHDMTFMDMSVEKLRTITLDWLEQNDIRYDEIVFTSPDKRAACSEHGIDVMVEDTPSNVLALSEHLPVLCFHNGANAHCSGEMVHRCHTWFDVYAKVRRIAGQAGMP